MFTGFMSNTWIVATLVGVVAGMVGFSSFCGAQPSPHTCCR